MTEHSVTIAFGLLAIFLAGLTYGTTGFGFGLVSVPLLLIFLPPRTAVPTSLVLSSITGLLVAYQARASIRLKRIWPLMVGGALGIPLGTYLLTVLDSNVLRVVIGGIIFLSALAFLTGFRRPLGNETIAGIPVGVTSGILNGATGMSGPPVILFFNNQGIEKTIFRANLATYFLALNLLTFPTQWFGGLLTREVLIYALAFLPAMAAGSWAGIRLSGKINERLFRTVSLALVAATGLVSVATGLRLL